MGNFNNPQVIWSQKVSRVDESLLFMLNTELTFNECIVLALTLFSFIYQASKFLMRPEAIYSAYDD